jgi:hypothetical protein
MPFENRRQYGSTWPETTQPSQVVTGIDLGYLRCGRLLRTPPDTASGEKAMSRLDVEQINRNRKLAAGWTEDTPLEAAIDTCDADYAEILFTETPADKVGFLPKGRRE